MADQKSAVVLRWYDEVWNKSNEGAIDELMSHETKAYGLSPEPVVGIAGFKTFYWGYQNAYADIKIEVDKIFVDGDYVIALCTVKGKHKETGKPVEFTGTSITRIENGKIVEGWNHFDFLSLNMQIGKIKEEQLL